LQPRVLDLNSIVSDVDRMLRRVIGEDIDLVAVPGTQLWSVKADPGQLEQVLMNLAVNARDAMPKGGKLTIETANAPVEGRNFPVPAGEYVRLSITDTGTGMDPDTQARIFEPFFTTKGQGKGTGLGLATVYGIVEQSGGYVWVYSELGVGSTFKVYLPRAYTPPAVASAGDRPLPAAAHETVLVVEDEEAVR